MKDILKLVVKLLKFWGNKTVEMVWILAKMYMGRLLWKWGVRLGLLGFCGVIAGTIYYLFK